MRRDHGRFVDAGASVVLVGQGTPAETAEFAAALDLPYPVLADPERAAFAAFGLRRGDARDFLSPASGGAMLRALVRGNGGGRPVGDLRQLGGAFVIDPAGIVRLSRPDRYAGDPLPIDRLLAAVAELD